MRRIFTLLLIFMGVSVFACEPTEDCIEEGNWQIGIAIGLGVRTNPLVDGDNIPLVVLPDIAWYGESAYFDNGELGYQWINDDNLAVETFIALDRERAFFSFWHPDNVLVPSFGFTSDLPESTGLDNSVPGSRISIDEVANRKWAVNGGVRAHYHTSNGEFTLSWQGDVSQVHEGHKVNLAYRHNFQWQDWQFSVSPRLSWKSENLLSYYYGISARDYVESNQFYVAKAGFQPGISFSGRGKINQHWQWLIRLDYQKLNSGMRNSPLVEQNNVSAIFVGAGYRF